jgi:MFS transporter, ACS family, D-galactonate transporter
MHCVYKWFADQRRALPTSVVASGAAFGGGLIAPLITWIITHHGWHAAFALLGAVGLAWAVLWGLLAQEGPLAVIAATGASTGEGTAARIPYYRLLSSRTAVGVFIGGFAAYWIIALNLVWLANYLVKVVRLPPGQAAWVITLPSIAQMVFAPACAEVSQVLTRRGWSSRIARGGLGSLCVILAGVSLASVPFASARVVEIALVGLSFSIGSVMFTLGTTLIGEISPTTQRGAMLGITNSIHTLAGLCAPLVMGLLVDINSDPAAGFRAGYLYAGVFVALLGGAAAVLINPEADLRHFQSNRAP